VYLLLDFRMQLWEDTMGKKKELEKEKRGEGSSKHKKTAEECRVGKDGRPIPARQAFPKPDRSYVATWDQDNTKGRACSVDEIASILFHSNTPHINLRTYSPHYSTLHSPGCKAHSRLPASAEEVRARAQEEEEQVPGRL
jgi:hypothetical protein